MIDKKLYSGSLRRPENWGGMSVYPEDLDLHSRLAAAMKNMHPQPL